MNNQLTLGSLFDGIGGFPLAGIYAGMKPVWASEIEPFPIRVTTKRLPEMHHYGDIHALNGEGLPPVDVITFGSPCQNLSIAGKRSGLGGEQSSLFFEAVRVIKEMRRATNGQYPRYLVWENVPGALSSANGLDYREVLHQLVSVCEGEADVPMPENGKWLPAGEIMGDSYSLAWRILDAAQGWGVAQRRKRIFVVVDLGGQRAGKILFESEGVSGYSPPSPEARKGASQGAEGCTGASGQYVLNDQGGSRMDVTCEEISTLRAKMNGHQPVIVASGFCTEHSADSRGIGYEEERSPTLRAGVVPGIAIEFNPTDSRIKVKEDGICQTLTARCGTGGNTVPLTLMAAKEDTHVFGRGMRPHSAEEAPTWKETEVANTLNTFDVGETRCNEVVVKAYGISSDQSNAMLSDNPHAGIYEADTSRTLDCNGGSPVCNQGGIAVVESYALQGNMIGRKDQNGPRGSGVNKEVAYTLNTIDQQAVCAVCAERPVPFAQNQRQEVRDLGDQAGALSAQPGIHQQTFVAQPAYSVRTLVNTEVQEEVTPALMARDYKDPTVIGSPAYCMTVGCYCRVGEEKAPTLEARNYKDPPVVGRPDEEQLMEPPDIEYLVRRLTPLECCRLQGYPDGWTENLGTEEPTEQEIAWWSRVFEEWNTAQGKQTMVTRNRIIKWLKDPRSDAAEYKAYGNSVAVPCVFFVLAGIVWAEEGEETP